MTYWPSLAALSADQYDLSSAIETSSLPHYEPTRRFYLKHGYELGATLRDFYAEGDDMVVFRKLLL